MTADEQRDDETARWNAALATGDRETINWVRDEILVASHTRIMDDDPNYKQAGWS